MKLKGSKTQLAFSERNQADFDEKTRAIENALLAIETNSKLPATGQNLAQMAQCTRKTLHNRRWPLEQLKNIQAARRAVEAEKQRSKKVHAICESGVSLEESLISQISVLQDENGTFFHRIQDLEEKLKTATTLVSKLAQDVRILSGGRVDINNGIGQNSETGSNVFGIESRQKLTSSLT